MVMSYAETAIGLGLGVFDVLSRKLKDHPMAYLPTTRFCPDGVAPWFTTREEHSHAIDHMILQPAFAGMTSQLDATLVLVDDETTTGKTFAGLAEGLANVGERPSRVILATLTDWSDGDSRASVQAIFSDAEIRYSLPALRTVRLGPGAGRGAAPSATGMRAALRTLVARAPGPLRRSALRD